MAKKKKKATKKTSKKKQGKKVVKQTTKKASAKKPAKKKATSKKKVAKKAAKAAKKKISKKKVAKKTTAKKVEKKSTAKKVAAAEKPEKPHSAPKKVDLKTVDKGLEKKPKKASGKAGATAEISASESAPAQIKIQKDVVLTDAEGRILCRVRECDQPAVVESYCRYHYLLFWKKIQIRKKILSEGKLEKYIEELTSRYPNKYLDLIKRDLSTEADFLHAIQELEIDESSGEDDGRDYDEERSFIEEVRGVTDTNDRDESEY